MRSLVDLRLKDIIVLSHYLLRSVVSRIVGKLDELHLVFSTGNVLHLEVHHRVGHLAGDSYASDHRIGLTLYSLDSFLDGDVDTMIDALATAHTAEKLKQQS